MKFAVSVILGITLSISSTAFAAAPDPAHIKSVQDLLASMKAEKMLRTTASSSRYASEAQRKSVFDKLDKVPPAVVYQRLAVPVSRAVSLATATEMARFYNSPYGQKVIHQKYNSGPGMLGAPQMPTATAAEKKDMKRPAYVKASKELAAAEAAISHESFVLLSAIIKEKPAR